MVTLSVFAGFSAKKPHGARDTENVDAEIALFPRPFLGYCTKDNRKGSCAFVQCVELKR